MEPLTQEVMVISVRGHDVFDYPEFLDNSPGIFGAGCGSDHPYVTRGELDGSRTASHWEKTEEFGKGSREGEDIGGDLRRCT